jgi:hypothetical protein
MVVIDVVEPVEQLVRVLAYLLLRGQLPPA